VLRPQPVKKKLVKKDLGMLREGSYFGELALLFDTPRRHR
jgi:CRP-like cAMP-binding protein